MFIVDWLLYEPELARLIARARCLSLTIAVLGETQESWDECHAAKKVLLYKVYLEVLPFLLSNPSLVTEGGLQNHERRVGILPSAHAPFAVVIDVGN